MESGFVNSKIFKSSARDFYKKTCFFLLPALSFIAIFGIWLATVEKGREVIFINGWSKEEFDPIVLTITQLGLGSLAAMVGLLWLFKNVFHSFVLLNSLAWVGIFTFLTKRILFFQHPRPLHYFLYDEFPRFLHDVPLIYYNSFPSGHTMTIFALAAILSYISNSPIMGLLWFGVALIVGLSRIYLLQHFGADVAVGALMGVAAAFLALFLTELLLKPALKKLLQQPLMGVIKHYHTKHRENNIQSSGK